MKSSPVLNASKEVRLGVEDFASKLGASFTSPAILVAHTVLDQRFTADINILLTKKGFRWLNVLLSYEGDDIDQLILAGKRATWPKVAMIAKTLDGVLERLDAQQMQGSSGTAKHLIRTT